MDERFICRVCGYKLNSKQSEQHLNTTFIITELSPDHFLMVFAHLSEIIMTTALQLELEMLFLRNIIRGCFGFDSIDFGW